MMSREAIRRGYNRGNYIIGAPTPPYWAPEQAVGATHPGALQTSSAVVVSDTVLAELRVVADEIETAPEAIVDGTRDWWSGTKIPESEGTPAITVGVIVKVSTVDQVQAVMQISNAHDIPVTVSAGRSNVTGAALPLHGGIVLDVCGMNRVLDFDPISQIVTVEPGIFGDVFEAHVQREYGMTAGHWPSSFAISTVGGWVACRGAGQLSTRYGKIEDMVAGLDVVLSDGSLVHVGAPGRSAVGSDLQQVFVGSEGTLGIITTIKLKLHRLPDYAKAVAYGFKTFAEGLDACRKILQRGATPAALRLYDELESGLQFDESECNVLLIADEGEPAIVDAVIAVSEDVCGELGAIKLDGDTIFERWLDTRYLTGKATEGFKRTPGFVADTMEITGPWRDLPAIYDEVVTALAGIPGTLAGSAHQSHAYVDSACIYFSMRADVDPTERSGWYRKAWDAANAVLIRHGATLSHHHGVGVLRSPYMEESLGDGFDMLRKIKSALDPKNLLNPGKLGL